MALKDHIKLSLRAPERTLLLKDWQIPFCWYFFKMGSREPPNLPRKERGCCTHHVKTNFPTVTVVGCVKNCKLFKYKYTLNLNVINIFENISKIFMNIHCISNNKWFRRFNFTYRLWGCPRISVETTEQSVAFKFCFTTSWSFIVNFKKVKQLSLFKL